MLERSTHTHHSLARTQQRGINELAIQLLLSFGSVEHQREGEMYRYFSKRDLKKLNKQLKRVTSEIDQLSRLFAVELEDGRLKTVGYQTRHHKRS